MRKAIGYFLILTGAIGILATLLFYAYLAMLMFIWCPIQRCIPQFIVCSLLAGGAIALLVWLINRGQKMASRRRPL